jgi:hypothetical protein
MKPPHDRATPERLDPAMCVINYERKEFQQAWFRSANGRALPPA